MIFMSCFELNERKFVIAFQELLYHIFDCLRSLIISSSAYFRHDFGYSIHYLPCFLRLIRNVCLLVKTKYFRSIFEGKTVDILFEGSNVCLFRKFVTIRSAKSELVIQKINTVKFFQGSH